MKDRNSDLPIEMGRFFDERVGEYEDHIKQSVSSFDSFYRAVASAIEETTRHINILDLGSGTGIELKGILARAPNARITCIDISGRMLDELKNKYADSLGQIETIKGSFLDIPFQEGYFRYVVSVMTMHHLTYEQKLGIYTKIKKCLAYQGKYIEADYIVPYEDEQRHLAAYKQKLEAGIISPDGLYHIDIPFSITTQRQVLLDARFSTVELLFETEYAAVLSAY